MRISDWSSDVCSSDLYGGQGLPSIVGTAVSEYTLSANLSFKMYHGLTNAAVEALIAKGSEEQKRIYIPNMVSGKWAGTMNLTEPHCGTDLGLIKTRAEIGRAHV